MMFISYLLFLGLINTGFSFLFKGIINPQIVALTPEFELYDIPIMSGLVLVIYRFTGIFGSKVFQHNPMKSDYKKSFWMPLKENGECVWVLAPDLEKRTYDW